MVVREDLPTAPDMALSSRARRTRILSAACWLTPGPRGWRGLGSGGRAVMVDSVGGPFCPSPCGGGCVVVICTASSNR